MPYTSSPPTSAIPSLKCVKSTKKRTFKPETANWVHRADPSASQELSPHSDPTQLRSTLLLRTIRLTLKQIMEGAESSKSQGDSAGKDSVQESFLKLVNAHFVESCPAPEPVLEQATKQEGPAKKRGAKSAKMVEVPETMEQRVLAAAAPPEGIRFSIMIDSGDDAPGGKSDNMSVLKVPLSLNTIYEEVLNSEAGRSLTMGCVRDSLSGLCDSSPERDVDEDESYSADLTKILELAQDDEVESIVSKRYGKDVYTMFRILSLAGRPLETDKISDTSQLSLVEKN
ncbi:DNA-directed RNA polymerase III subunit RPC3 isoform X1 [Prunus yedoensis var. nudiflora]|uniref:DNA-directed RNA polymerase III subunit RPC3 n=1 Tax=Prunus yedoensis var. nudiflora TaxID=2094558 RepID=A0A314Y8N9_PRUYE|nr:DNA-directed RNA polymerase III subunit RPC3 isoform X1 [Prunus yedoensis var. nudiflora]